MGIKLSQMKSIIKENFKNQKNPLFFHGSPGIGKTEGVEQAVHELEIELKKKLVLKTIILSQYESVDLRGLPSIINHCTVWNPPQELSFDEDAEGIIFFDELSNAMPDVQKAAQQLIHARQLGELRIPKGICFVAAGNRQADKAGSNRVLTALANRFEHHTIEVHGPDWIEWAMENKLAHEVIGYNAWQPQHLNDFDPDKLISATPRAWAKASGLIGSSHQEERLSGVLGEGVGSNFIGYLRLWRELPSCEEIWKNPAKVPMPEKKDIQFAIAMSLALKATPDNFDNSYTYIKKCKTKDMIVAFLTHAVKANKEIKQNKKWLDALKEHREELFN